MSKIHVIIPTYKRSELIIQCVKTLQKYMPDKLMGKIVIIDQNTEPSIINNTITIKQTPGYIGPKYKIGAETIKKDIIEDDIFMFIDDDIFINHTFTLNAEKLIYKAVEKQTGCIQLYANRQGKHEWTKIKLGFKAGGMICQADKYWAVDGHGNDYLDDVELFLKFYLAGYQNYRCGAVYSKHMYGSPGGLREYFGVTTKALEHISRSRLIETYPGIIVHDSSWLGFKIADRRTPQ